MGHLSYVIWAPSLSKTGTPSIRRAQTRLRSADHGPGATWSPARTELEDCPEATAAIPIAAVPEGVYRRRDARDLKLGPRTFTSCFQRTP
jgi:hypothetical protein